MSKSKDLESIITKLDTNSLNDKDIDSDDLNLQQKRFEILRYEEDTNSRKNLAYWAATVVSIYLFTVLMMLLFNDSYIGLSDQVLSILLGTTTLNVLGLMYIVLKGYFKVK